MKYRVAATAALLGLAAVSAAAQALPPTGTTPYPGVMTLQVDTTDLDHKIFRSGVVSRFSGLQISANGKRLAWRRNTQEADAFHIEVPAGVSRIEIESQTLTPLDSTSGRITSTPDMLGLQWDAVLLYPAGYPVTQIMVQPSVTLPEGWQQGGALEVATRNANRLTFKPVSVETLVDSPLFAGKNFMRVDLDPDAAAAGRPPVFLDVVADQASQLAATPEQLAAHRALVTQADRLFGARHFAHYDFLLALSESFGSIGLEHHQSSENGVKSTYFTEWAKTAPGRDLLAHEYVHSWNGKYRRPAELATPDYHQPMGNRLLWVYEGLTEYWGRVLAVRAGLSTADQTRDRLANVYADIAARAGRAWRPLQDTVNDPAIGPGPTREWEEWQRGFDYYDEAQLLWLDVDLTLRQLSKDQRSLDDFARAFHGGATRGQRPDGSLGPVTYTEDDVIAALNAVQPHDWRRFLHDRLDRVGETVPGLAHSGWRIAWVGEESSFETNERGWEGDSGTERPQNLAYSLGLRVIGDGGITQVYWGSPAFEAGLTKGMTLVAVNDRAHKAERLEAAIRANTKGEAPLRLLVKDGELYRTVTIDWRGGLRYPRLERVDGTPDRLGKIWKAR